MGGGLSNGGDGLCRRGQVCTGRLGHHIQGMLQGVAKQRKQIKTLKSTTYNNLYMYVVQSVAKSKKITSL